MALPFTLIMYIPLFNACEYEPFVFVLSINEPFILYNSILDSVAKGTKIPVAFEMTVILLIKNKIEIKHLKK